MCGQPFLNQVSSEGFEVWCGYGPCISPNSNNGFSGKTLNEAFEKAHDEIIYPDDGLYVCPKCNHKFDAQPKAIKSCFGECDVVTCPECGERFPV